VRSLRRAILLTVAFTVCVPGCVVGLVPWLLTRWQQQEPWSSWLAVRWLGAVLVVAGLPLLGDAILRFAIHGRGTPAPTAPTERLVVTGPYRFVRNPMYVGVLLIVAGQALWFASGAVLIYAACLAVGFHTFVRLYEEPILRRTYGAQYETYCRHVRRWWPRLVPFDLAAKAK
jgi:protein-S-isoprenylcysteine O-methyltransferase Ste14